MNKTLFALALVAGSVVAAAAHADSSTWTQKIITPEVALKAAQAAKAECAKRGWQVAVTVTDPSGLPLVMLRDRYAGWHTVEAADGKARTAASWRQATSAVAVGLNRPDSPEQAIKSLPGVVMVGGGLPIDAAGQMVGTIGVSGAPGGANHDICAKAGLDAVAEDLAF
ncbi:GlcG/HbpS family heme-binding protein [Thiomonas intermedia]|uniref:GlcG/HbpS family heme-binding protein n=1 Tax=Thiomonas intermedia TaxID=926 RepID=UPI0009A49F7F|nr:heme-binding protein [Thiomonas intermedia]